MSHFHWGSNTLEEGRWGGVDRSITIFHVWVNDVGKDGDEAEVGEVVEGIVGDRDRVC